MWYRGERFQRSEIQKDRREGMVPEINIVNFQGIDWFRWTGAVTITGWRPLGNVWIVIITNHEGTTPSRATYLYSAIELSDELPPVVLRGHWGSSNLSKTTCYHDWYWRQVNCATPVSQPWLRRRRKRRRREEAKATQKIIELTVS